MNWRRRIKLARLAIVLAVLTCIAATLSVERTVIYDMSKGRTHTSWRLCVVGQAQADVSRQARPIIAPLGEGVWDYKISTYSLLGVTTKAGVLLVEDR